MEHVWERVWEHMKGTWERVGEHGNTMGTSWEHGSLVLLTNKFHDTYHGGCLYRV